MNYGVNLMREHIRPTARIHYVIADGGGAPNVVPEYARVWYFVRDVDREKVDDYYQRILKIVEGAALATGTTFKINFITGLHQYNLNQPLLQLLHKNLTEVGPPVFTEEEQKWGRDLQKFLEIEEIGFHTGIEGLDAPPPEGTGSTDVADVSFVVPTAGFGLHLWECLGIVGPQQRATEPRLVSREPWSQPRFWSLRPLIFIPNPDSSRRPRPILINKPEENPINHRSRRDSKCHCQINY